MCWLPSSNSQAWLFWDAQLGLPDADQILEILSRPGDVWHAGLRLGMAGLPGMIDFVSPTWMLNRDPEPSRVARADVDAIAVMLAEFNGHLAN